MGALRAAAGSLIKAGDCIAGCPGERDAALRVGPNMG